MTLLEHFCANSGNRGDSGNCGNCRNNWNRNWKFVGFVMPGSVSGVFQLKIIVFVMPVSISEMQIAKTMPGITKTTKFK